MTKQHAAEESQAQLKRAMEQQFRRTPEGEANQALRDRWPFPEPQRREIEREEEALP